MDVVRYAVAALAVIAIVLAGLSTMQRHRRRRAETTAWAEQHGWSLVELDEDLPERFSCFPVRGAASAGDLLTGDADGTPAFSCCLDTSPGDDEREYWHVVGLRLPAALPMLEVVRADLVKRRPRKRHLPQIAHPGFERAWSASVSRPEDEPFARQLLTASVIDRLLARDATGFGVIAVDGDHILASRPGRQDLDRILPTVEMLRSLARRFPRSVLE